MQSMKMLVVSALAIRKALRLWTGYVAAAFFGVLVMGGFYLPSSQPYGWWHLFFGLCWLLIFSVRTAGRVQETDSRGLHVLAMGAQRPWSEQLRIGSDLELSLLLLVAVQVMVQMAGGLASSLHALVYVLVAFVAAFSQRWIGLTLVATAIALEAVLYFVTESRQEVRPFLLYAVFLSFFGLMNLLFTHVEISLTRQRSRRELDEVKAKDREDARMFRLVSAPTGSENRDEERVFRSSVEEVHQALFHTLELLRESLRLHTCILLFQRPGKGLDIVELSTDSDEIAANPLRSGEGVVGAVMEQQAVMNLKHLKPGYRGLCYYKNPAMVRAFLGVPVIEDGSLRGVLCADRLEDEPFTHAEERIMQSAVRQILRAMQNERVFVQLERSKYEQTVLYQASQALGSALDTDEVLDSAVEAFSKIAAYDLCAITTYDTHTRRHHIVRAEGHNAPALQGLSFVDNTSLTAMVVKTGHYLPYRGDYDGKQQVYTKRVKLDGMHSLLVLPLTVQEHTMGTVALAATRRGGFRGGLRSTLRVLANQLAVSLSNAASVKRLEDMATTDGLTGCLNKRAFLTAMERKVTSSARFERQLSLVIADLDYFKRINDTYGHAVGDKVLQGLGEILKNAKRETDVVARFGGEEFCILCEETDMEGALLLAERIREEVQLTRFSTDAGKLSVTCSLGVATYPVDAQDQSALFEAADRALYDAKKGGRNRVCTAHVPNPTKHLISQAFSANPG